MIKPSRRGENNHCRKETRCDGDDDDDDEGIKRTYRAVCLVRAIVKDVVVDGDVVWMVVVE